MKNKKIIIGSIIGIVVIVSVALCVTLFGNDSKKDDLQKKIDNGDPIEIIVKDNGYKVQGERSELIWVPLADLTSYAGFRTAFENALGITKDGSLKVGPVYVTTDGKQTNNSTLYNAFMNKAFTEKWNDGTVQLQLQDGISTTYADLEESDYTAAIINAYFNLIDDNQPNFFNGGASLSRAQAMTLLMRAVTPVEDLKANEKFNSLVGDSEYTAYASYMDSNCFINSSDKSLSKQNFNGAMTRAEFIYMVMNQTFGKDAVSKFDSSKVKLNDCKNAGNIAKTEKFSGKDYCNSYVISEMMRNPDSGVTEEIYKAIAMAKDLEIIGAETRWDESISLTEGIDILISTFEAYTTLNGSKTELESGATDENTVNLEKEALEIYESIKNDIDVEKESFVAMYKELITINGLTKESAVAEIKNAYPKQVEQPTTEAPTEKPVEKPTEKPTTGKTEKPTLSLEEAAKLTPSGSYTEYKFQLGPEYGDALNGYVIVRKTYENGAVRDYLIVDGEECELDSPIGVVPDDYVPNSSNSVGVHSGEQQTQSQNTKPKYKGIYPARSSYSSDAEWEAAVHEIVSKDGGLCSMNNFASEADAKLYAELCKGGPYTGDMDWANMTTEEWLKWCEENGFTVN